MRNVLPAALAALVVAAAPQADGVRLPVVTSRLAAGAPCAGGSASVASAVPWEQRSLGLARTWQTVHGRAGGAGVTVAVVDTGVSDKAPALSGRVTAEGAAGTDCVGHGTFVAGLVAAAPVSGVRFAGFASRARILAVRGTDARGTATADSVADGIRAAASAGARVVVVSPALSRNSARLSAAVRYAAGRDALVIAAAVPDAPGTAASSAPPPRDYWPAAEPGVLSVVDTGHDGARPDGAFTPRRADLAAPGDGVVGIGPSGKGHYIGSGASFAAAYAAGAAALVRSAHPGLTAAQTAARLTGTAYPADVPRLDPYAALTSVREESSAPVEPAAGAPVHVATDTSAALASRRAVLLAAAGTAAVLLVAWAAAVARLRRRPAPRG